jgi:hypothetical protein
MCIKYFLVYAYVVRASVKMCVDDDISLSYYPNVKLTSQSATKTNRMDQYITHN